MQKVTDFKLIEAIQANQKINVTFSVNSHEEAQKLIEQIAEDSNRQFEVIESDNGNWYSLVNHRKDNFEVSVFVD